MDTIHPDVGITLAITSQFSKSCSIVPKHRQKTLTPVAMWRIKTNELNEEEGKGEWLV